MGLQVDRRAALPSNRASGGRRTPVLGLAGNPCLVSLLVKEGCLESPPVAFYVVPAYVGA